MRTLRSHIHLQLQRAEDLGLPPRTVIVRRNYFSPEEKEIYLSLFSDAKRQFATYVDQGTILNSQYSNYVKMLPFLFRFLFRLFKHLQFTYADEANGLSP
jgi:hypothetical protein